MADAAYDTYVQLDRALSRIGSFLHGTMASIDFFSDSEAEAEMIAAAQELAEEAKELADCLYKACRKERQSLSSRTAQRE